MEKGPTLYERMKARGINMEWYERSKTKRRKRTADVQVPLETETCCLLSVYLLKTDGSLWTTDTSGAAYRQVRPATKPIPRNVYVCACCKGQWRDYNEAIKHPVSDAH